jgi:hypothetical protein
VVRVSEEAIEGRLSLYDRPQKTGVAFWATVVAVVALVAYPLGFGPACWIASRRQERVPRISSAYRPIGIVIADAPQPIRRFLIWYGAVGISQDGTGYIRIILVPQRPGEPDLFVAAE